MLSYELVDWTASTGSELSCGTIRLKRSDNALLADASVGEGPIDAVFRSIDRIAGTHGVLVSYSVKTTGVGSNASGEVTLEVKFGDKVFSANYTDKNIIKASILVYLAAINRWLDPQNHQGPKLELRKGHEYALE